MTEEHNEKAVIYCRVSSKKQVSEGSGLDSQEHRCREYAETRGLSVEAVFPDDISGGGDFMKRPGMVALLAYLDAKPEEKYVVIFDDLKRYARDTEFHLKLRREMAARGAIRACLNFNFEDSPEGKFLETIIAAQGQLEREQNQRQVIQKMRARLEQGFWAFAAPVGYRYEKGRGRGQVLVKDEPAASVIIEALESYASGRFQSQSEIRRFLQHSPGYPKGKSGYVHQTRVQQILDRQIYAGYVEYEPWGVGLTKGQHEPLVSMDIWQQVQKRRHAAIKAAARRDINADFPLRGFITCGCCKKPYTACWSKGRNKHYPYYFCDNKTCSEYRKNIRKEVIEGDFEKLLTAMVPTKNALKMITEMMREQWEARIQNSKDRADLIRKQIKGIEGKVSELVDKIIEADSPTLVSAFEGRLKEYEIQKVTLEENRVNSTILEGDFRGLFRTALHHLSNPLNLWHSHDLEDKRAVLKLTFADRISYLKNEGFRTAKTTLPFSALAPFHEGDFKMVGAEGLEPPTRPL